MLADCAAAEDLAQVVFVQLHRHLATIESDAHLASWLRRVVTHRAIDAVRERKRRPVTPLDTVAEPVTAAVAERDPMLAHGSAARSPRCRPRPAPSSCCGTSASSGRSRSRRRRHAAQHGEEPLETVVRGAARRCARVRHG